MARTDPSPGFGVVVGYRMRGDRGGEFWRLDTLLLMARRQPDCILQDRLAMIGLIGGRAGADAEAALSSGGWLGFRLSRIAHLANRRHHYFWVVDFHLVTRHEGQLRQTVIGIELYKDRF
jgi:hypothetical protein